MKPIYDAWLIQIEITNACGKKCAYCTRAVPHFKNPYFAEMTFIEAPCSRCAVGNEARVHGWRADAPSGI